MDVSAQKRKSAFAAKLADQDAAMAQLQAKLNAARVEGKKLKAQAEDVPEAPVAPARAGGDGGASVAVVVSETATLDAAAEVPPTPPPVPPPRPPSPEERTPTTADLLALAATTNPLEETNGERCAACGDDAYALRSQLVPCTSCGKAFHAGCVRLRAIPFRGSTRADRRYRELFVKRYFGDWMCQECERRPAVVCAPSGAAGCDKCAALTARVAALEAELAAHRARDAPTTLEDVPRDVLQTHVFQFAAHQQENEQLQAEVQSLRARIARLVDPVAWRTDDTLESPAVAFGLRPRSPPTRGFA